MVVPFLVSLVILYLLFLNVDITNVRSTLQASDGRLLLLAVLISLSINIFLGTEKWRRILQAMGCSLPYREVLSIRTGCIPFKLIFPMKSSELLKALYLNRKKRLSFNRAVSSLIIEKALNLLVLFCLAGVGMIYMDIGVFRVFLPVVFVAVWLLLFSSRFRSMLIAATAGIHPKIHGFVDTVLSGFGDLDIKETLRLIGYSFIYQSSELVNTYILLMAVGVSLPFSYLLIVMPVIMIVNNLPVTVLGLGTREAAIVFFFSKYGSPATLLSGSILVTLVEHVLPVLVGIFFIRSFHTYFMMKDDLYNLEANKK